MRSLIASLRNLVLPAGATSGARIVLDGDDGVILVFDSTGALLASIAPEDAPDGSYLKGITAYSPNGIINLDDGDIFFLADALDPQYVVQGNITQDNAPGTLRLAPPTFDVGGKRCVVDLNSVANDSSNPNVVLYGNNGELVDLYQTGFHYFSPGNTFTDKEVWHNATLLNGGVNATTPVQFRMLPTGHVECRGALVGGTLAANTHLFSLPAAGVNTRSYIPVQDYRIGAVAQNTGGGTFGTWVLDVQPTGFVSCLGVPTGLTQLHFDNVFIPVE